MKYLINLLFFLFTLFFELFTSAGCSSATGPITSSGGRRDYTWTVDTIKTIDPLPLSRIWGSTPNDVWAVGNGATSVIAIWYYNGNRWGCDSIYRPFFPWAVIGFSSNEVWIGNTSSTI